MVLINKKDGVIMQTLCESEYQDIYRIKDGVLLVVNKFKPIDYSKITDGYVYIYNSKTHKYKKGCQNCLKILKEDYICYDEYADITIPKGTVVYYNTPVELLLDKSEYQYQIKTTGEMFSGNSKEIIEYINDIISVINNNSENLN